MESFSWCVPVKYLAWAFIEVRCHAPQFGGCVAGQIGACGDNAAMQSIFALVQKYVLDTQH
jgi:hypothetical protein